MAGQGKRTWALHVLQIGGDQYNYLSGCSFGLRKRGKRGGTRIEYSQDPAEALTFSHKHLAQAFAGALSAHDTFVVARVVRP